MRTYRDSKDYLRLDEATRLAKLNYLETVFIDEEMLAYAIEFYNLYFQYEKHPIGRTEALAYANLGVRLNADLFKSMRPFDIPKLDFFYQITPFYFFHDIIRFMDGYHMEEIRELEEKHIKPPVLDFAGGTGGFSIYLAKKGIDVTFFESNLVQLNWMKWLVEKLKLNMTVEHDRSKLTRKFHSVLAKDIAEHVVDPGELRHFLGTLILDEKDIIHFTQVPCCGPDEFAPMHFRVGLIDKRLDYNVEENLRFLQRLH